jgi:ABC-type siderophore export system fused ATPase/permease subunit
VKILLSADIVLALIGIAFILAGRAGRKKAQRTPTYAEQIAQMTIALREIQIAIGTALLPTARQANEAFKQFGETFKKPPEE